MTPLRRRTLTRRYLSDSWFGLTAYVLRVDVQAFVATKATLDAYDQLYWSPLHRGDKRAPYSCKSTGTRVVHIFEGLVILSSFGHTNSTNG